jgi:hypothetical protein
MQAIVAVLVVVVFIVVGAAVVLVVRVLVAGVVRVVSVLGGADILIDLVDVESADVVGHFVVPISVVDDATEAVVAPALRRWAPGVFASPGR